MHFIFEVHVREGHTPEQYADAWVRASRIIQREPGALGTRLHRIFGATDRLVAIASWESKEARDLAEARLRENAELRAILTEAGTHAEIEIVGELDRPEWVVLPE